MITKTFIITTIATGKTKTMTADKAMKFLMKKDGLQDWEAYSILARINSLSSLTNGIYEISKGA